jgi:hypothetical protein
VADNTTLSTAVGTGDSIRTEDRTGSGPKTPVSLIDVGGTSAEALIGDSGVAMPVRGLAAEDAAASGNPVPAGGRYDLSARTLDDGDRGELALNASAQALVEVATSALPSGAATSAKQDTGNTSLSSIDGKITACNTGAVVVSSALPAGTNNIGDVDVLSIAAGDNNIGNVDIVTVPADPFGANADAAATAGSTGSIQAKLRLMTSQLDAIKTAVETLDNAISGSEAQVDIVSSALPTGASTLAEQQTQTTHLSNTATSVGVMDDWDNGASDGASVSGDVAHDGVDAGEPVKIGAKAIAYGSNPTAVAAADRTDLYANRHGVLMVLGGVPGVITKEWTFADADGAQTDAALVTVSAGTKIAVTNIAAICDNANTGDVAVRVGFAAASLSAAATTGIAGIVMSHPGIAAGSGYNRGDGSGVLGVGADGEDLRITCEDPAGGSIRIIASYFEIAS